ncbi:hypothetical protein GQ43DRAFT_464848 [Delitschia confertaspora ATCC 74209]|uniref:Septation initiation network scaffold protein cdc11 n=1 Tax=Delitschia confertaspora ATCC 74209 TaxID=1513339 RepID=A0A9P4MQY8_9PLEO|nr:hypothetical protein GQ43DRAFT_464848 [Delitschia confertaspora ATCC 74209]
MKPWLEDLSEDWVPPPDSSSPASKVVVSSPAFDANKVPSQLRSRLPRMRTSSGSFSEIHIRPININKGKSPLGKTKPALAERSLSDNNVASPSPIATTRPLHSRTASGSYSFSSANSVIYNGRARETSTNNTAEKPAQSQNTPEWRRRLLKGEIGYGDQRDLFSPMGLENIFQKPSGSHSEELTHSAKGLKLRTTADVIPSSPPVWSVKEEGSKARETRMTVRQHEETPSKKVVPRLCHSIKRENPSPTPRRTSRIMDSETLNNVESGPASHRKGGAKSEIPRTISQQLEIDNENFSPVILSTDHKVGGTTKLTSLDSPATNSNGRLRHRSALPIPSVRVNSGQSENPDDSYSKFQEDTLPEDLPAGTPDVLDGGFVCTRRGGYSQDGSFRRRALSPTPPSKPTREGLVEGSSMHKDKELKNKSYEAHEDSESSPPKAPRRPSPAPVTPNRRRKGSSQDRALLSASPLKLFDTHDTFTSNRLQRRLSQLENRADNDMTDNTQVNKLERAKVINKRLTSVEEASFHKGSIASEVVSWSSTRHSTQSKLGTFGQGQLDEYEFSNEFPTFDSFDQSPEGSSTPDVAPPGSRQPTRFYMDGSSPSQDPSKTRRQGLTVVSNFFKPQNQPLQAHIEENGGAEWQNDAEYAEGKRGPTSPSKDPIPKRRRTLHSLDYSFSDLGLKLPIQSIVNKTRKDAGHDNAISIANPEVLARRHILRPRNPTPSQRRREEVQAEILEATEAFILSSPKLNTIKEQLMSPINPGSSPEKARATAVASEVAAFNLRRAKGMKETGRKRSVTTQDFLDEAVKIMEFIRTKGRPTNGLASLEEADAESPKAALDDAFESTALTFSRPPSREGGISGWREPNKHELDSHVLSHLKKFQDKDSDCFMASSMRSLSLDRLNVPPVPEDNSTVVEQNNIRITDNRTRSIPGTGVKQTSLEQQANSPQHSIDSLGRTVGTNVSRRSDHVATLAPEAVAHLIPERIGGMSFDRERGIWVKQKSSSKGHRRMEDCATPNESEEDPFGNIPDLTVDELRELMMKESAPHKPSVSDVAYLEPAQNCQHQDQGRPATRDGKAIPPADTSSAPSKASNFAWSFPKTETRATSWSEQDAKSDSTQRIQQQHGTASSADVETEEVEHEIQYHEDRHTATPGASHSKVRDITISFASQHHHTSTPLQNGRRNVSFSGLGSTANRKPWRTVTAGGAFPATRVAPIEEAGELSVLEDRPKNYRMQLSMNVSAPFLEHGQSDDLAPNPSSPSKLADVTFMLSDLPEFTLHQVDECEIPDRVVVTKKGSTYTTSVEDRYATGTAALVKALQDVESEEPYWEDLRSVDLHDKGLSNVHRLDKFCFRLEEVNISANNISQVRGLPSTVRRLNLRSNCLTGLTSWSSLMNLQHLDVSNNDIDSLDGLGQLIHLRTLRADHNRISSLAGIFELDGLMELRAESNRIRSVNFKRANLKSLVDLNLKGNELVELRDLHCLPRLQNLDLALDNNSIAEFPVFDMSIPHCDSLRSLSLNNNGMRSLNVEPFPRLETLKVDSNCLTSINGLESLEYLRKLSGRGQTAGDGPTSVVSTTNLIKNTEVRSLYLSLNPARFLDVSQHLLNLQRLELASMGLAELPDGLGLLVPNVRFVNLNFNSITDLRPLLNIKKLDELLVAGNKLSRLRTNLAVLAKLPTLTKVDLRDNPMTMRFYAPAVEQRMVPVKDRVERHEDADRFILPRGSRDSDEQYLARLDDETRLRRRVHEMMVASSCPNLRVLDGLEFDIEHAMVKDDVWRRLSYLGVLKRTQ